MRLWGAFFVPFRTTSFWRQIIWTFCNLRNLLVVVGDTRKMWFTERQFHQLKPCSHGLLS